MYYKVLLSVTMTTKKKKVGMRAQAAAVMVWMYVPWQRAQTRKNEKNDDDSRRGCLSDVLHLNFIFRCERRYHISFSFFSPLSFVFDMVVSHIKVLLIPKISLMLCFLDCVVVWWIASGLLPVCGWNKLKISLLF